MKKIADFIVEKHKYLIVLFVILTGLAAMCSQKLEINSDLKKYLPETSDMKIGMDLMNGEFGENASSTTAVRVMFTGLTDEQKQELNDLFSDMEHIDSVSFDMDSEDYVKDEYTKYDLTVAGAYGSDEWNSVQNALDNDFSDYEMVYVVDDTAAKAIPKTALALAFGILVLILLIMSQSWFEPLLFVVTIGMAIIMNIGSNLILGSVSNTTQSIGPILQLVLSMDYSIILMNRYHQELEKNPDRREAMKSAWTQAFASIFSSSFTTVVGLLALVFMSFKLGRDLGIVLAKGVLISVITVLTFLPGITLICTPIIQKTKKKVPVIPTGGLAKYSHKFRYVITPVFVALFVGMYFLQQKTELTYTMPTTDEISEIFPTAQTAVLLYENQDEDTVTALEETLENYDNVVSVTSYGNLIAKEYTADEMYDHISEFSDGETQMSKGVVNMLFYSYFTDDEALPMTAAEFINFLADDVVNGDDLGGNLDENIAENIDNIKKYADPAKLTQPMSITELSDFMEVEEDTCKSLFLLYYIENGGVDTGKMTIGELLDFIVNDLANDEEYSDTFDSQQLDTAKNLLKYTDKTEMTAPKTYKEAAKLLDIEENTLQTLYVKYYSDKADYTPDSMTLPELVSYLKNDIMTNESFADRFDSSLTDTLNTLKKFTDPSIFQRQMNTAELADLFGIDESSIRNIFISDTSEFYDKTMSAPEFLGFVVNYILPDETYGAAIDDETKAKIMVANSNAEAMFGDTQYGINEIASLTGMDESIVSRVFMLRFYDENKTMSPQELVQYILNNGYAAQLDSSLGDRLNMLNTVMRASANDTQYDHNAPASLFGMQSDKLKLVYTYKASEKANWKLSVQTLLNYIVKNKSAFADTMDKDTLSGVETLNTVVDSSIKGTKYTPDGIAELVDLEADTVNKLFLLNISRNGDTSDWKMSVQEFVTYLSENVLTNEDIADRLEKDTADMIGNAKTLIDAVVSGKKYTPDELYDLISDLSEELSESKLELIYLYHDSKLYADPNEKLSVLQVVDFLTEDIFNDSRFAEFLDDDSKSTVNETKETLYESIDKLRGETYSRVLIRVKNLTDMDSINAFYDDLNEKLGGSVSGEYHFIGDSAMSYEMSKTFGSELTFITLLTAAAIFIVVAVTFRNLALPTILVLIVQCGVYIAVSIIGLQGMSLYYLTLLMVECILMGSTIDYGILFSTYYRDCRETMDMGEALKAAYHGSIETIMTSGSILVIVTGVLSGYFPDPSTAQICRNISIGAFSACMLILFILPGVLATSDRLVKKRRKR